MILIPARLKSSRFPRKILAEIGGVPMIVRCARVAAKVDEVAVACEDSEVVELLARYGVRGILTSDKHTSGTDRCAEAAKILGLSDSEIVINMQGDEPFLESALLEKLRDLMLKSGAFMGSLCKVVDYKSAQDSNLVKVLLDANNNAIYFSRSLVPYPRDFVGGLDASAPRFLGHLGVYGFSAKSLKEFCNLPKSPLEEIEKLEQLRAIYHAKKIAMAVVETQSIGIDTQADLEAALKKFAHKL